MAEEILKQIRRVGLDDFDSDPRNPGAVGIFKDSALAETIRLLAEYPAATRKSPNTEQFSHHTLQVGRLLHDRMGWDVVPHFVLATNVAEFPPLPFPIHTDGEGSTFADARTFTIWVARSHFGEPHLMLFKPKFSPPPDSEFHLDENGLYGRTMLQDEMFRHYSTLPDLGVLEISLKKDEILAFNGSVPHFTHPDTPRQRSSVNFRCPSNRGSMDEPELHVNMTSPYGRTFASHSKAVPFSPILSSVDARTTPKGYYEVDSAFYEVARKARNRHHMDRIKSSRLIPSRWRKTLRP
ncbi:MAG: hypothetical protein VX252_11635 [Myxococcota bacterium]|nr:hypothetical protein [Myxococcota bacterium]